MPILRKPLPGSPLCQGDVLHDVVCTVSDAAGVTALTAPYALVMSRPCDALRDGHIVVAPVNTHKVQLGEAGAKVKEIKDLTLDDMRRLFAGIRDGGRFTDTFYLGNIGTKDNTRYAARLSILTTIGVPTGAAERAAWIIKHRVASLGNEFARDLHLRLFATYARLGFDDYEWYPEPDLEVMITAGQREVAACQQLVTDASFAVQKLEAVGTSVAPKMREEVTKKQADQARAEAALAPFLAEQQRRAGAQTSE